MSKTKVAKVEAEVEVSSTGFTVSLTFTNGQRRSFGLEREDELLMEFAARFAKDRLTSAANNSDDADKAVEKIDALIDAFDEGKMGLRGEDGPKYTPLVRALAELRGQTEAEVAIAVQAMSKSTQAKLRATPRVAVLLAQYKAEAAGGKSDGDDALDAFLKPQDEEQTAERAA